jgi:hypothetical protein
MSIRTDTHRPPIGLIGRGLIMTGAAVGGYLLAERWRWRATELESTRPMPLDDEIPDPTYVTNRAVTIQATPEEIWPWIAQMGELPRAGYYSYPWIERALGLRVRTADRIEADLQDIEVGQTLDRAGTMVVKLVDPEHCLVLGVPRDLPGISVTWALGLHPLDAGSTRLISRVRARVEPRTARDRMVWLIIGPGQLLMEGRMLGEIRRLAERTHQFAVDLTTPTATGEEAADGKDNGACAVGAGALKGGEIEC